MGHRWSTNGSRIQIMLFLLVFEHLGYSSSSSLHSEGLALLSFRRRIRVDPFYALHNWNPQNSHHCNWNGVQCENNRVHALNLNGLLLEGTLAPELGGLPYLKSLILSNNHFSGIIPKQFGGVVYLEVLDLRNNHLCGPIPTQINRLLFLEQLILCNNNFEGGIPMEIGKLNFLNHVEFDANLTPGLGEGFNCSNKKIIKCERANKINLMTRKVDSMSFPIKRTTNGYLPRRRWRARVDSHKSIPSLTKSYPVQEDNANGVSLPRRLGEKSSNINSNNLRAEIIDDTKKPLNIIYPPFEGSSGSFHVVPINKHIYSPSSPQIDSISASSNHNISNPQNISNHTANSSTTKKYISGIGGVAFLLVTFVAVLFFVYRKKGSKDISPLNTGLSGQLQKALVNGVSKLNRVDLETACEDFSNIIETNEQIIIYKGTLSNGTQMVVVSTTIPSIKEWTQRSQNIFEKMIDKMSRVNHKNFLNLIGYCEEDECFSRMMVFEYAVNGTLAEHLKDAEKFNWMTRMKIGMGICYCLQHMHNLDPPIPHSNVNSEVVYLTEEFTAKLGEVCFWSDFLKKSNSSYHNYTKYYNNELPSNSDIETNVYDFGIVLLELISGKLSNSRNGGSLMYWASQHLNDKNNYMNIADKSVENFKENEFMVICDVVRDCIQIDATKRPTMNDITTKLRTVLDISPEHATSKELPIWWVELQRLSSGSEVT